MLKFSSLIPQRNIDFSQNYVSIHEMLVVSQALNLTFTAVVWLQFLSLRFVHFRRDQQQFGWGLCYGLVTFFNLCDLSIRESLLFYWDLFLSCHMWTHQQVKANYGQCRWFQLEHMVWRFSIVTTIKCTMHPLNWVLETQVECFPFESLETIATKEFHVCLSMSIV
jgi:hypothetical protein